MSKLKLLIVEDNPDTAAQLMAEARLAGFDFVCVNNPGMALRIAADKKFEIAIVDICLPGLDGFGLARLLRSLDHAPQVFLISSGPIEPSAYRAARAYGAAGIYNKPDGIHKLIENVRPAMMSAH